MAKTKPLIAVGTVYQSFLRDHYVLREDFIERVKEAGGIPVMLPVLTKEDIDGLMDTFDGLLLPGGADIPPQYYGEKPKTELDIAPLSQIETELLLIRSALQRKKPIFGICLGHQLLNIVFGGSLYQQVPTGPGTTEHNGGYANGSGGPLRPKRHLIHVAPGSQLAKITNVSKFMTFSKHHQAVREVGRDVKVVGRASDGVIEATEFPTEQLVLSLQWHPEEEKDSVYTKAVFRAFINASRVPASRLGSRQATLTSPSLPSHS